MLQLTNRGFTLLEMNVYLLIVAMMGMFLIPNISYLIDKSQVNNEMGKLDSQVRSMQLSQLGSMEKQELSIQFNNNGYAKQQMKGMYSYSSPCHFKTSFPGGKLVINENGRLSRAGKVTITCGMQEDVNTFNIGYGYE